MLVTGILFTVLGCEAIVEGATKGALSRCLTNPSQGQRYTVLSHGVRRDLLLVGLGILCLGLLSLASIWR